MDAKHFAAEWQEGWNSHDLDRILSHYRDDIVFRSRKAIPITGDGLIQGKTDLRAYWAAALARQPDLRFQVQDVFVGFEMMVITYRNHRDVLAAETLQFDPDGMVYKAAACHRIEMTASDLLVTVGLWIKPGQRAAFDAFETQAFEIMRTHGARIFVVREGDPSDPDGPDEVHLLRFPSQQAFDAYRTDPRLTALAAQRDRCIAKTDIQIASEPD